MSVFALRTAPFGPSARRTIPELVLRLELISDHLQILVPYIPLLTCMHCFIDMLFCGLFHYMSFDVLVHSCGGIAMVANYRVRGVQGDLLRVVQRDIPRVV